MKQKHIFWPVTLTIILIILTIFGMILYFQKWEQNSLNVSNETAQLVKEQPSDTEQDLTTIIHETQKFVVQIEAEGKYGQTTGSGFIYNNKGDVITNAHVVEGADSIFVKTSDARTYPGALIGVGSNQDIAVIRVPQLVNRNPLPINPTFEADLGDEIIAVGSPFGFQNTVTLGIISGKNRTFSVNGYEYEDVYQISASVSQGNSGGPLIHVPTGKIIGINSAGTQNGSIGFSIPIQQVYDLVKMWSDRADNRELDFDGYTSLYENIDPNQLKQDAQYIVNYFYESLQMRDYFNAYALLGSQWQTHTTYQQFRENYVHLTNITVRNIEAKLMENNRVEISLNADYDLRKQDQTFVTEHYQIKMTVGYENDQLKILDSSQKLLSTTVHEPPEQDNEDHNE
ncbi:MAG: trypsin-like peptidase domain-containing protein [Bacillaceae bacterium]|nr:trypsin-like peptidase domain-containing protein [Bacillaceae bacterium]